MNDSLPPQERLRTIWRALERGEAPDHTSVVVPSLSFDVEELTKIPGAPYYEERLLFSLMRLRNPRARVIYLTSQPVHPDIVDYYLHLLAGVPARHARDRLKMICVWDGSSRPLTAKILERPRVVERIRRALADPLWSYLTCFNSTALEAELATRLGIPLNGVDPGLLHLGSKSGSRRVFAEAGVACAPGREEVRTEDELVAALAALADLDPAPRQAVVKLNESFAGAGNAVFRFPADLPAGEAERQRAIRDELPRLAWFEPTARLEDYLRKLGQMGGVVEAFVEAEEVRSPSVQMRIDPDGVATLVSSHDQVLGGPTGQTYLGCRFPADRAYRSLIESEARKVGAVLARHGVVSRFGVDFLVGRQGGGPWRAWAIEINLRMGGTTPPFLALQFLTGGALEPESGEFLAPGGRRKYYRATDALYSPAYRGLLPEDLLDILTEHGLQFLASTETGVLFHMIGALSPFGKVGVTCIGDSREEAEELFDRTARVLDQETSEGFAGPPQVATEQGLTPIE